ncbi:MAG: hypothetical protein JWM44_2023 [Bacilli bacterium]|nr:hypothetical protein [Bacilli bacterium]
MYECIGVKLMTKSDIKLDPWASYLGTNLGCVQE